MTAHMTSTAHMDRAIELATSARVHTSPNPWVGCVLVTSDGQVFEGATEPPGSRHAEIVALNAAHASGADTHGATVYTTLEPCNHHGRTGACTEALIAAGVTHIVSAIADPDPRVSGQGFTALRAANIDVQVGSCAEEVREQLHAYIHHRTTGRPFVVLKLAMTLDGRTAAADGSSQWITGEQARIEAHRLRAESDVIVVGAQTVRSDDPSLTTRLVKGPSPRRIVLGSAPGHAKVQPCTEWTAGLPELLDLLGQEKVLQVMIEGGASVAASFHRENLVDRYVLYIAPAFMGGDDGAPLFRGAGAATMQELWRANIVGTRLLGEDIEIVIDKNPQKFKETV